MVVSRRLPLLVLVLVAVSAVFAGVMYANWRQTGNPLASLMQNHCSDGPPALSTVPMAEPCGNEAVPAKGGAAIRRPVLPPPPRKTGSH